MISEMPICQRTMMRWRVTLSADVVSRILLFRYWLRRRFNRLLRTLFPKLISTASGYFIADPLGVSFQSVSVFGGDWRTRDQRPYFFSDPIHVFIISHKDTLALVELDGNLIERRAFSLAQY